MHYKKYSKHMHPPSHILHLKKRCHFWDIFFIIKNKNMELSQLLGNLYCQYCLLKVGQHLAKIQASAAKLKEYLS